MGWSHLVTGAVLTALFLVAATASLRAPVYIDNSGTFELRYSRSLRIIAAAFTFLGPALVLVTPLVARNGPKQPYWTTALVALSIGLLGAIMMWEIYITRLRVSPTALEFRSAWGPKRIIEWRFVKRVTYSTTMHWFVIASVDGTVIRTHLWLQGIAWLVNELERRLPFEAYLSAEKGFQLARDPNRHF